MSDDPRYEALLSDLEDWAERLERAADLNEPRRVAEAMRATLATAGRNGSEVSGASPLNPTAAMLTDYWDNHYCAGGCTLCGNSGVVDTRGTATPAGMPVGRLNFCICPNGQIMRAAGGDPTLNWPDCMNERYRK